MRICSDLAPNSLAHGLLVCCVEFTPKFDEIKCLSKKFWEACSQLPQPSIFSLYCLSNLEPIRKLSCVRIADGPEAACLISSILAGISICFPYEKPKTPQSAHNMCLGPLCFFSCTGLLRLYSRPGKLERQGRPLRSNLQFSGNRVDLCPKSIRRELLHVS